MDRALQAICRVPEGALAFTTGSRLVDATARYQRTMVNTRLIDVSAARGETWNSFLSITIAPQRHLSRNMEDGRCRLRYPGVFSRLQPRFARLSRVSVSTGFTYQFRGLPVRSRAVDSILAVHLLSMTTFQPHPLATSDSIDLTLDFSDDGSETIRACDVQTVDNLLVITTQSQGRDLNELWAIDWKESRVLMVRNILC